MPSIELNPREADLYLDLKEYNFWREEIPLGNVQSHVCIDCIERKLHVGKEFCSFSSLSFSSACDADLSTGIPLGNGDTSGRAVFPSRATVPPAHTPLCSHPNRQLSPCLLKP